MRAGRVQSVALRLVCEREAEIEAFLSREYWTVHCLLEARPGQPFPAQLVQVRASNVQGRTTPCTADCGCQGCVLTGCILAVICGALLQRLCPAACSRMSAVQAPAAYGCCCRWAGKQCRSRAWIRVLLTRQRRTCSR